jgi:probable DNA repair protein
VPSTATRDDLLTLLQRGEMLLLPNDRAARELRVAYDARQRARGLGAWQPAAAQAWPQWTSGLYGELIVSGVETRLLLNPAQQHSLWREIIADDPPEGSLDSTDALAELADSAFRLAAAWNATARLRNAANSPLGSEDTRTFARWAEEFQRRCAAQKLLPAALLESTLSQHSLTRALPAPESLQLIGFASLTPAQQSLLDALEKQRTRVERVDLAAEGATRLHVSVLAENPADELRFAARWLRKTLEYAQQRGESPRIALLVPGLDEERGALEAELRETLAPELQSVAEDLSSTPWEFSTGVPLSSLGIITDALDLVRWVAVPLPLSRVSALLLSPYLSSGAQREQAAQLDALVRKKENLLRPELTLDAFVKLLDKHRSELAWPRNLATELARSGDLTRNRSHADWTELLRVLVRSAGWPNSETRELTAAEFEATRAWDGVLDLVATLDFSGRRVAMSAALQAVELQARATPFTPFSTRAAVQIMTPAEAEGSAFDAALFLRATDDNWPAGERPHPLLPWHMQREVAMPGTDPARSAARARLFIGALLAASDTVLFSSAKEDGNGDLRPSPLLAELQIAPIDPAELLPVPRLSEPLAYELVLDDAALPPLPSNEVQGGARVLQLQAACGFQAFAEFRLNAKRIEDMQLGFDAPESGRRLHDALQLFWKQVRTQDALRSMPVEDRDRLLRECVGEAVSRHLDPQNAWDRTFVALQKDRMLVLLRQWMATELQRGPFTVLDSEQKQQIAVGPLSLEVRLDRIDSVQTAGGDGFVLVDYKTGASGHPHQWTDDRGRPDDPQLPLYSLLDADGQLKGLAFAKVVAGEMRWLGYQAEEGILPKSGVNPVVDLPAAVADWRDTLEGLAYDFADGHAAVDPKEYPSTCQRCAQRLLCRVDSTALRASLHGDDEQEALDG